MKLTDGTDTALVSAAGALSVELVAGSTVGATQSGIFNTRIQDSLGNNFTGATVGATRSLDTVLRSSTGAIIETFGGTAQQDKTAFSVGTTQYTPAGGLFLTVRDSVTTNQGGTLAMTAKRGLYTVPETPAGTSITNETASAMRAMLVDNAGAFIAPSAVDGALRTIVVGAIAHNTAGSTDAPVKQGHIATSSLAAYTPVANNAVTNAFAGLDGVQIVRPYSNLEDRIDRSNVGTAGTTASNLVSAGAGLRFCATTIIIANSSATNVTVDLRDGTAGAVLMTIPASANMGGAVVPLAVPICTTAGTALAVQASAAASTITVTAVGFKTKL